MPINPIAGVSILFHLAIIGWHKLQERIPARYLPKPMPMARRMSERAFMALGCSIIAAMFLFVLSGAGVLIYSSLNDEHATYRYAPEALSAAEALAMDASPATTAMRATMLVALFVALGLLMPATRVRVFEAVRFSAIASLTFAFVAGSTILAYDFANDVKGLFIVSKDGELVVIAPKLD